MSHRNSGIGGQAVMEGVMMRNKDKYAVSVRLEDGSIVTDIKECKSITEKHKWMGLPFIRGTVNLIESTVIGMNAMTYSANFFETEEERIERAEKEAKKAAKKAAKRGEADASAGKDEKAENEKPEEKGFMTGPVLAVTLLLSFGLAMVFFMLIPQVISELVCRLFDAPQGGLLGDIVEGVMRLVIFIVYVKLISLMNDIKRTFMYHGAEHKSINCLEEGLPLTVENVKKSSKFHKRCGTSFLIYVMIIAIIVLIFVPDVTAFNPFVNFLLRFLMRLAILPVIAGISYEVLKFSGTHENSCTRVLSKPGFWMQSLTVKEPTDDMIEVGIKSVEAVFDWRGFLKEKFPGVQIPETVIPETVIPEAVSSSEAVSPSGAENGEI